MKCEGWVSLNFLICSQIKKFIKLYLYNITHLIIQLLISLPIETKSLNCNLNSFIIIINLIHQGLNHAE